MVTGRKAFSAKSQASLISAIMSAEPPPIATEQPLTPPALERIVKTCLIKDPDGRWQSAHDVKLELTWLEQAVEPAAAVVKSRTRERIAFGLALVLLAVTLLLAYGYFHRGSPPARVVRSSLLPPPNHFFQRGNFAVSPDGTRLAFVAVGPDGSYKLWVRTFSASNAQPLNGTEGAILPFWAPDSRRIGFFASGKLNTIDIESGALRILGEAPTSRSGGTWSPNGTIVFSPALIGSLHRIPDTGGTSTPVTRVVRQASGQKHLWPSFLPDGKHFLFFAGWGSTDDSEENGIYVGSLDGSAPKLISSELTGNVIYSAGHLLYGRDRSLRAQLFDTDKLNLSGQAISISEQELEVDAVFFHSEYSISQNGVLVFQSLADSVSRLVWFDQTGKELGQIAELGYSDPRLSPDGRSLAVSSDDARNGKLSIRVYDLARAVSNRLTDAEDDESPAWSHDGGELAYATLDPKAHFLKTVGVDGSGPARALVKASGVMRHLDWAVDGHLVFTDLSSGFALLKIYSAGASKAVPFGNGAEARFSPDGKWIAYVGIPTGGIFVQPFPGPGGRIGISGATGAQPVWARDGKQVFYIAPDRKLMAVSFDAQHKTAGAPRVLFQTRIVAASFFGTQYDVAPDGRFLINSVPANYSSPLTLLTGWTAQLKQ
jgi:Tol biopolymer transport system component